MVAFSCLMISGPSSRVFKDRILDDTIDTSFRKQQHFLFITDGLL